jgi:hypothetical protein
MQPLLKFDLVEDEFTFKCPCGCGDVIDNPIRGFTFTNLGDGLTIRPSITLVRKNQDGRQYTHWQGFLTKGKWEESSEQRPIL